MLFRSEGDGTEQGRGGNGLQAAAGKGGEGQGSMNLGINEAPKRASDRGAALQPIIESLAGKASERPAASFVLSHLQEGSLMGNHLLDALALGAGVGYGVYAPRVISNGQRGLRGLVSRVQRATGLGQNSAALKEQRVISVFATTLDNGQQRLVAARVSGDEIGRAHV